MYSYIPTRCTHSLLVFTKTIVVSTTLVITQSISSTGYAASFDCSKASTKTEIEICADPTISNLDERIVDTYLDINKKSKYYKKIRRHQMAWINDSDRATEPASISHLSFLNSIRSIDQCLTDGKPFPECEERTSETVLEGCMAEFEWSTYAMITCSSGHLKALETISDVETEERLRIFERDPETLDLFKKSIPLWEAYRGIECDWQYSEYREGTIRGPIHIGCLIGMTAYRIGRIYNYEY